MNVHPPAARTERGLATSLALIAGYLDGYGLLALGTYVSFMSGNTTMTGVRAGQGKLYAAYPASIAIVFFVVGSFLGNLVTHSKLRNAHRTLFAVIASMIAATAILAPHNPVSVGIAIAILSTATGMMNPALSKVGGEPVSLTFMTGTLSRMGGHFSSAVRKDPVPDAQGQGDSHWKRAGLDATVWISFVLGAALAGLLVTHYRAWALIPPCLAMFALTILSDKNEKAA